MHILAQCDVLTLGRLAKYSTTLLGLLSPSTLSFGIYATVATPSITTK